MFDTAARMDLTGARALGQARDARWAAGPDYTVVRLSAPEGMALSAQGQGGTWTVSALQRGAGAACVGLPVLSVFSFRAMKSGAML